ncbi:MAG TPA: tRNA (adenosine(37)-N6)-threonylcarbamoyltransferase complex ATPase subunit type 1 TsaE [Chthoniobacterales bacterium]|nr:tRNA (adenosine(37)-N6)-threonylcarbamoyltransferase complex ATPase subunit type 1 TsaE [Chthoniobacterales bacterium]
MATYISDSAAGTERAGREFARELVDGSIVALAGPLGAGKTQFVKGVVAEIGAPGPVTSPTFTLIHEYTGGRFPVYHFDFFRIEDRGAAERLGLEDYFYGDGVCVVEWADKFGELMPPSSRWIAFEIKSESDRLITIT